MKIGFHKRRLIETCAVLMVLVGVNLFLPYVLYELADRVYIPYIRAHSYAVLQL